MGILVLVLIGLGIYLLYKKGSLSLGSDKTQQSAVDILDERFANGEIDEAEYKQKKSVLKG